MTKAAVLSGDETKMLKEFWEIAKDVQQFIGHNVMDFDLQFIYKRSIINGVRPTQWLSFARYRNNPIYDTMREWEKWSMGSSISLDMLAKILDLESSKSGGLDGSKVFDYYQKGKLSEIYDYCAADVKVTREIYKKMTFTD